MKVPLSWLKEFFNGSVLPPTKQLGDLLTAAGLEVEGISLPPLPFSGVVVGKVLAVAPHPQADRLRVATVSDGSQEFQVVCGAPNCREGIFSAFAREGAILQDENGKAFKIKKSRLRGVDSYGMLCAIDELGLGAEREGILELSSEWAPGTPLEKIYGEEILDISLTPNLGHCMSLLGIAREVGALLQAEVLEPLSVVKEGGEPIASKLALDVLDTKGAPRFACRLVKGVRVAPSPLWLQKRLELCGIRSINNVVDVGNLVMLELGQPLHMFDYDKIRGKKLFVASKTQYAQLPTLDGEVREIPPEALLVCDEQGPLSFAGILGGSGSLITDATLNVVIEAAHFRPEVIRKGSKLLSIRTESCARFEKGVDPNGIERALNRAAKMLQEIAGGEVAPGIIEQVSGSFEKRKITCRPARVNQILGTNLSVGEIATLLHRNFLELLEETTHSLTFLIPTFRFDLREEVDLIEEVARMLGYANLPKVSAKSGVVGSYLPHSPLYLLERRVRSLLIAEGLQEVITCDLISPTSAKSVQENALAEGSLIEVLHPSSAEQSVLRTSLLPGLLTAIAYNQNQSGAALLGFEIGKVHFQENGTFHERLMMGVVLFGSTTAYHFDPKPREVDFLDLKGIVENMREQLHLPVFSYTPSHLHSLHPGKQALVRMDSLILGALGEVHPHLVRQWEIAGPAYFAEIDLEALLPLLAATTTVKPICAYPGSERDWTVTVADKISVGEILAQVRGHASPLLEQVYLLDLYKSEQIGKDKKNVTLRFFYRDLHQTIACETVDREHAALMDKMRTWYGS